ncbi:hypothetical protein M1N55_06580, partial [Dehalococcoidia bacterium]|nr:hypothetical protein [Dehalococcoidia bacterium]
YGGTFGFKPLVLTLFLISATLFACDSNQTETTLKQVIDDARTFTVEDLRTTGMKTAKQYDVSDLPGGIDAWYGFIKTSSGPMDIEARFYASHSEAISLGTSLAEEVSGEDANVDKETTTWLEGLKDRTRLSSGGTADLAAWSGQRRPNYADFVIFGNIVLLCQGDDSSQSVQVCHELIAALPDN